MTQEELDIELIERYLEGRLSQEELNEFRQRLSRDRNFEKSVETYKAIIGGIKYSGENILRQKLKKLEASITAQENLDKRKFGIPLKPIYSYSAAATILLLLTFTFIFILRHNPSPREVFTENFKPYSNVVMPTTRGEKFDKNDKNEQQEAFYLYDRERYQEAAFLFDKLLKQAEAPALLLYSGNSYMAAGDYDAAIKRLKKLSKLNTEYKHQAQWFLALAYLAKNEPENGKPYLEGLAKQNISYSKKAVKILEDLQLVGNE